MRRLDTRIPTALAVLSLLALAPAASAADEQGDAGDLPATAQDLSGAAVETISGTVAGSSDIDMYRVCVDGGRSFSASSVGGTEVDTQLFLFDSAGRGVYANDDEREGVLQSLLPAGHEQTPTLPGRYYLAVGAYNTDPEAAGEKIFGPGTGVVGPTGSGGGEPVSGWGGRPGGPGPYTLVLTGASCAPVPVTPPPTVDLRSPVIQVLAPLEGAVYLLDQRVRADYSCADEPGGSGLASCAGPVASGAFVDTVSVGPREFTVTAADGAGNTASATARYRVLYDFDGFLSPVRNRPRVNTWVAGASVPVRFSLGGNRGLDVIADGWPQVAAVDCDLAGEPESGEPARRQRPLAYRKQRRRYALVWKTDRRWAGSCRQLMLKLEDGTVKRADFKFVRGDRDDDDDRDGDD